MNLMQLPDEQKNQDIEVDVVSSWQKNCNIIKTRNKNEENKKYETK